MARHRAPDVVWPLHGVHLTGNGRPRHAAAPVARVHAPDHRGRHRGPASPVEHAETLSWTGSHRARPALELVGPLVVAVPEPAPRPTLVERTPTPVMVVLAPAPEPAPQIAPEPEATPAPPQPLAETITWAGFACLVSCAVVAGGQGPREEGMWILGVSGGALTTVGLSLLLLRQLRQLRHGRAAQQPQ